MTYLPKPNLYQKIADAANAMRSTYELIRDNLFAKPMFEYVGNGDGTPEMPSRQPKFSLPYVVLDKLVPPVVFEYGHSGAGDLQETQIIGKPGLEAHLI